MWYAELSRDIEQRYGCHVVLDLDDDIIVDSHHARGGAHRERGARQCSSPHASEANLGTLAIESKCVQLTVADDGDGMPTHRISDAPRASA